MMNTSVLGLLVGLLLILTPGCDTTGDDANTATEFSKQIEVFGLTIQATAGVSNDKMLHAAHILAEYLDNDEDGVPDNAQVLDALRSRRATLVMFRDEAELDAFGGPFPQNGQDLHARETHPAGATQGLFDASLEEVLHLITHVGYASVYPAVFGEHRGSALADAMDSARGGYFAQVPSSYPTEAWYTYDDRTCDYACQVTEYTYWALTSLLGGQHFPGRLEAIRHEWRLNTPEKLQAQDPTAFAILTDPQYKLPTTLPDGQYRGSPFTIEDLK